ncbi:hypothetical protein AB1E18_019127 [Capra hircus]
MSRNPTQHGSVPCTCDAYEAKPSTWAQGNNLQLTHICMDWLLFFLLPGTLMLLCWSFREDPPTMRLTSCISCDEYIGKNCRKNLGSCQPRYPDLACQTKEVYSHHYTGDYIYQYSVLGCPRRCAEYTRITPREKIVFFCCNTSHCNSLPVKDVVPFNPIAKEV